MDRVESERARLVSLMWNFCVPQILHSIAILGIADLLADGPRTAEQLAQLSGSHALSLYRLLRASVALDMMTLENDLFALTAGGELLRADVPGSVRNMVLWYGGEEKWSSWGALDYSVRTGHDSFQHIFGQSFFERLSTNPAQEAIFNETMAGISRSVAQALSTYPALAEHTRMADVGGGSGALLAGLLTANPRMLGVLYDTDSGLRDANALLTTAGVRDRCEIVSGDFFESVPEGCDAYMLKHIVHDWDDDRATRVLQHCRAAMTPDATLYLVESVVPAEPAEFDTAQLIRDLNMLVSLPGKERTEAEFARLFATSGLKLTSVSPLPAPGRPYSLISAVPA
jgi:orsellinic acid C2-O-methyltransferase